MSGGDADDGRYASGLYLQGSERRLLHRTSCRRSDGRTFRLSTRWDLFCRRRDLHNRHNANANKRTRRLRLPNLILRRGNRKTYDSYHYDPKNNAYYDVKADGYDKSTGMYTPPGSTTGVPMWSTKDGLGSEFAYVKDAADTYRVYGGG